MWTMINVMDLLRCPVYTLCIGKSMSAASFLLVCGTKGKRFAARHSRIIIHEITAGAIGKLDYINDTVSEFNRIMTEMNKLMAEKTKMTIK